jgi:hypothetical protein
MPRKGQKLGPRRAKATISDLVAELRRSAEVLEEGDRLIRFAVECERAIYMGRLNPDAIPRDVLMLLVEPRDEVAA